VAPKPSPVAQFQIICEKGNHEAALLSLRKVVFPLADFPALLKYLMLLQCLHPFCFHSRVLIKKPERNAKYITLAFVEKNPCTALFHKTRLFIFFAFDENLFDHPIHKVFPRLVGLGC
jgi:hypothetical protein